MSNVRWLIWSIGLVRYGVIIGLILFAVKIVANLTMTGVQKWIIDDIFMNGMYEKTIFYLSIFTISLVIYNAFHAIAARYIDGSAFRLFRLLAERLLKRLHQFPTGFLQGDRTAKFVNHVTSDVHGVSSAIQGFLPQGLQYALSLVLLCGFIGWASPLLLTSILLVSVTYIALGRKFSPRVKSAAREVQDRKADLLVHIEEGVSSSREVIAFHRLDWEEQKFAGYFERYFHAVKSEAKLENTQILRSDSLRHLVTFLTLGIGGAMTIQGKMSIGTFVVVFQFAVQLMESAQGLFQFVMQISGRMSAVERLRGIIERDTWNEGSRQLQGVIRTLTMDNVRFRYEDDLPEVLKGVTAELPIGMKLAFVGTSGGGKSTISQLLIRFYEPAQGQILVNGIPLSALRREDWSSRVQIVFQEPYLFPDTIRTNIMMGRNYYSESDMREACRIAQINSFIEGLPDGYDTEVGERGITLSGGQRQRIAIARALLGSPEVLILDEATSALDLETERKLQNAVDEVRHGLTTIVIAHRLSTVQNSDVIYVMHEGKVAEAGTHERLLVLGGVYASLSRHEQTAEILVEKAI
jgi:ABC-type multidrug transport system fused ATPase/permease subunit